MQLWSKTFFLTFILATYFASASIIFVEDFSGETSQWIPSAATKIVSQEEKAKYDGNWDFKFPTKFPGEHPSRGLLLDSASKHHAISARLPHVFEFDPEKEFVLQYEVKLQNTLNCGGAYIKLLSADDKYTPENFDDKTPYTIMFGPDKCGNTNKVHLIFRVKNPITGEISEKHLAVPPTIKNEGLSDLYTLIVQPDNTFKILINLQEAASGSLLDKFSPPFVPPETIDDPTDSKPEDWVDQAKIPDPDATKPDDWDEDAPAFIEDEDAVQPQDWLENEPLFIPDPTIEKPSDWNEEDDGEWEAPSIENPKCKEVSGCGEWKRPTKRNPNYKGKWKAPLIDNPAYKGPWKARQIPNPEYYEEPHPNKFTPLGAIGFELWTLQDKILFDNILIATSQKEALEYAEKTWKVKYESEKAEKEKQTTKSVTSSFQEFFETLVDKLTDFYIDFSEDPIEALKANPTISILLVLIPTLIFLLIFAALSPSSPPLPRRRLPEQTPPQTQPEREGIHAEGDESKEEEKQEKEEEKKEK